jgi:hypothetical protein
VPRTKSGNGDPKGDPKSDPKGDPKSDNAGKTSVTGGSGRATPKGGSPSKGAPSGRYTPPIPREVRRSPQWFPYVLLSLLVLGLLMIVLNYVQLLPGGTNNWYLIGGIVGIVGGLIMATFYH